MSCTEHTCPQHGAANRATQAEPNHWPRITDPGVVCSCGFTIAGVTFAEAMRRWNEHARAVFGKAALREAANDYDPMFGPGNTATVRNWLRRRADECSHDNAKTAARAAVTAARTHPHHTNPTEEQSHE